MPCLNNGICNLTTDGYKCTCATGYGGVKLERINEIQLHFFKNKFSAVAKV